MARQATDTHNCPKCGKATLFEPHCLECTPTGGPLPADTPAHPLEGAATILEYVALHGNAYVFSGEAIADAATAVRRAIIEHVK